MIPLQLDGSSPFFGVANIEDFEKADSNIQFGTSFQNVRSSFLKI